MPEDKQPPLPERQAVPLSAAENPTILGLREVLDFNESENQKHRDYFQMLYKWTAGSLTIIVIVIGGLVAFVGWHTISDIRKQAQDATNEEIAATRIQNELVLTQELTRLQVELNHKLNDQFKTENIRHTVEEAARLQTSTALAPLITHEVKDQVASGVHAEQQTMRTTLLSETHTAVDALKPTINQRVDQSVAGAVNAAVKAQVDTQVAPRLKQMQDASLLSSLTAQAQTSDGTSFDSLAAISQNLAYDSQTRNAAARAYRAVMLSYNNFYTPLIFTNDMNDSQKTALLQSENPGERRAAIDNLPDTYWKLHFDQLYTVMIQDSDLATRQSAYVKFKQLTNMKILNLDNFDAAVWWEKHRPEFVKEH